MAISSSRQGSPAGEVPTAAQTPAARSKTAPTSRLQLLGASSCSAVELAVVAAGLIALAFAVYGVHVARGGLSFDDWTLAYDVRHATDSNGALGAFRELMSGDILSGKMAGRPIEAAYDLVLYSALGHRAAAHLAVAVLLAALVAFLFYATLRLLRLERLHAAAISTLVLLFPAADSTVFWATGAIAHVAVALFLLGVLSSIRGLRSHGRRALAFQLLGVALYTASLLQYQLAAPFVFLSVFIYRLAGATWRRALAAWSWAAVAGLVALVYVKSSLSRGRGSLSENLTHARDLAGAARQLLASLGIQGAPPRFPTIAMAALLFVAGAAALLLPATDAVRAELRRWLLIVVVGIATIGAAYTVFIPADFYYSPITEGIGNRVNAAAALGYGIVLYGLAMIIALLAVRAARVSPALPIAAAAACAGTVALLGVFVAAIGSDRQDYERAAELQREALAVVEDVGRPPAGTTIYLFGIAGETAPNVFTFVRSNDLSAALRLLWNDDSIMGVPVSSTEATWPGNTPENSGIRCEATGVQPRGWLYEDYPATPYGTARFVDVRTRASETIDNQVACQRALAQFQRPGAGG